MVRLNLERVLLTLSASKVISTNSASFRRRFIDFSLTFTRTTVMLISFFWAKAATVARYDPASTV